MLNNEMKTSSTFVVVTLILFFGLCQVGGGAICPPLQLHSLSEVGLAADDPMTCPMPGGMVCQPQLTSSPSCDGGDFQSGKHSDVQFFQLYAGVTSGINRAGRPYAAFFDPSSPVLHMVSVEILRI